VNWRGPFGVRIGVGGGITTTIGTPDSATARTAWWPTTTGVVSALTPAAVNMRATLRRWLFSTRESTVPLAPARAVRPERCR
jgi:hypothetical protein